MQDAGSNPALSFSKNLISRQLETCSMCGICYLANEFIHAAENGETPEEYLKRRAEEFGRAANRQILDEL